MQENATTLLHLGFYFYCGYFSFVLPFFWFQFNIILKRSDKEIPFIYESLSKCFLSLFLNNPKFRYFLKTVGEIFRETE